jgi:hypothetical protein
VARSVPTMTTWTVGQLVTAALMNSNILALGTFVLAPPLAGMVQTLTQSIPNNAWTPVSLDTNVLDSDNGHSTTSNTSRYVIQVPGTYLACGSGCYPGNASGMRGVRFGKNGSLVAGSADQRPGASITTTVVTPLTLIPCVAGDYLELFTFQSITGGGALSTGVNSDAECSMTILRVSN